MVILHCLAHIKVDDLIDDANPRFMRVFYKVFRLFSEAKTVLNSTIKMDDVELHNLPLVVLLRVLFCIFSSKLCSCEIF